MWEESYRQWYIRTWPYHGLAAPWPYYYGGNGLLTIDMITRESIRLFRNSNWFLNTISRQFDAQFERAGAKLGQQLR